MRTFEELGEKSRKLDADLYAALMEGAADEELERLARASEALAWMQELKRTNGKGGVGINFPPFDLRGAWRLKHETVIRDVVYEPVIWDKERVPGVEPLRSVVELGELVVGQCVRCKDAVPLLGRSRFKEFGLGFETSVAVVHCDAVQPLDYPWTRAKNASYKVPDFIAFTPQLEPEKYPALSRLGEPAESPY